MTEPDPWSEDGARTRNRVDENHGYSVQAGHAHGDVHVGTSRTTTISLPAVSVIIGAVMTLVIGLVVWKFAAGGSSQATSTTPPSDAAPHTQSTSSAPSTSAPVRAPAGTSPAKEVQLKRNTGVDVDGEDTAAKRVDGAHGKIDLYLNEYNLLYANGTGFSEDRGPEQEAGTRCADAVAAGENTGPTILPASTGLQYCFVTSDGRVAWLRVKTSTLTSFDSSAYVVLAIRAW